MPSAKTYQAIGFVTYHAGRRELRRRRPQLQRQAAIGVAVLAGVVLLATVAGTAAHRRSRLAMH